MITSLDTYLASDKQRTPWLRTTTRTALAGVPFTMFDVAGFPGVGTLPGTSTVAPVMPDANTAGFPLVRFGSGSTYLSKIEYGNTVACRMHLFDMLSKSGAYAYTAGTTTITTELDISSRCPDYSGAGDTTYGYGNEIWVEVSTAFLTGNTWTIRVTYQNQAGGTATSAISPTYANAALILGRMFQIGLASGDCGVQTIKTVIVTNGGTAMTQGAVNVLILRPLWTSGRVPLANACDIHDMLKTGLPLVYNTSAFYPVIQADSTSCGLPEMNFELANG
jgi:hypothetical protein